MYWIQIVFYIVIFSTKLLAIEPLILLSPTSDFRSQKELVLFKGNVEDDASIAINGMPIPVFKNRFYIKARLNPHQVNHFIFEVTDRNGEVSIYRRSIDYFPKTINPAQTMYEIQHIQFDPLSRLWKMQGKAYFIDTLYIDKKYIPVSEDNLFYYYVSQESIQSDHQSLQLTGINTNMELFSHTIGLHEKALGKVDKHVNSEKSIDYKPIQSAILMAYYKSRWKVIPFTAIQEKMIHQLIESDQHVLAIEHLKLLSYDKHIVITVPYLSDQLSIQHISYQLMLILKHTLDSSFHMSVLWYNTVPNIMEVVFSNQSAPYWLIDDKPLSEAFALESSVLSVFKAYSFFKNE